MPNISEMLQSKYLKKEDFPEAATLTITGVSKVNIAKENEKPQYKYAMQFAEVGKPLLLNSTNIKRTAKACGSEDSDDWTGKKIVVYNDEEVEFGGEIIGGLRVRRVIVTTNKKAEAEHDAPF